ncbi:hypothetical protein Rcae01_00547 [Novipirellula caenicola]|uniref:Uncharacterized protein n=1 Tax=Novipirellula caenicola TaxID=1536901 RepID=A0ABP9VJY4_9BACT
MMLVQVSLPLVQRVDFHGKMAAAMMRMDRQTTIANQMQFLAFPDLEPCAGKIECGTIQFRQIHCVTVEHNAFGNIGDVDGDMVQLDSFHAGNFVFGFVNGGNIKKRGSKPIVIRERHRKQRPRAIKVRSTLPYRAKAVKPCHAVNQFALTG